MIRSMFSFDIFTVSRSRRRVIRLLIFEKFRDVSITLALHMLSNKVLDHTSQFFVVNLIPRFLRWKRNLFYLDGWNVDGNILRLIRPDGGHLKNLYTRFLVYTFRFIRVYEQREVRPLVHLTIFTVFTPSRTTRLVFRSFVWPRHPESTSFWPAYYASIDRRVYDIIPFNISVKLSEWYENMFPKSDSWCLIDDETRPV